MKILEMIQSGIITAEEGARLLSALDEDTRATQAKTHVKNVPFRMLKIKVDSADGDKVNIQIPVSFAKLALKSGKGFKIQGNDIGSMMQGMDMDQLLELIDSGAVGEIVNVQSADGDSVRIYIE